MTISKDPVKQLGELISDIGIAMLSTVEDDGTVHSRPMATQEAEFDGHLWFFTQKDSGKVAEVQKDRQVNLSYADPSKQRYVSVSGKATVLVDKKKAEELWNPSLRAWFPDGLDDPQLALLRVDVTAAEYWESPGSVTVKVIGFAKAILTGKPYQAGEHERLKLS